MDDKTQKLYQTLYDKGLYTKTFDDFTTQFSDEVKKEKLFNSLNQKGLYTKTYDEFNSQFFPVKKKEFSLQDSLSPASGKEELPFLDASGKPLTPQQPLPSGKSEERKTTVLGDLARSLKSSSLRALGGITETPMLISQTVHGIISRPIIKAMGGTDEEAQQFADYMRSLSTFGQTISSGEDAQKLLNKQAAKTEAKIQPIEGNIVQNLKEGNVGKAGELLGRGVVQSLPYLAMTAATAGAGTPTVLATIGATSASQQYGDLDKIAEPKRLLNSWMYGGFEAAGELVTAGLLRGVGRSFKQGLAKEIKPQTAMGFAKGIAKSFGLEGSSEAVTQIGQNFTDIVTGTDPNRNIFDNVVDAALIGGVSGGGIGTVDIAASVLGRALASKKEQEQVKNNIQEQKTLIDQIDETDNEQVKTALESRLKTLRDESNKVMDKNYEIARELSEEQQEKVAELSTTADNLQSKIDNKDVVTENDITAIENAIQGIENEIESIKEARTKELGDIKEEGVKFKIGDNKFETIESLESWLDKNYTQKELEPVWHKPTEKAIDDWVKRNKEKIDREFFEADQKRLAEKLAKEEEKARQLQAIEDLKAAEKTDEPVGTITKLETKDGLEWYNVVNEEGQRDTFSVPEGSPQEVVQAKSKELVKPKEIGGQTDAERSRTKDTQVTEQGAPELVGQESDGGSIQNNEQIETAKEKVRFSDVEERLLATAEERRGKKIDRNQLLDYKNKILTESKQRGYDISDVEALAEAINYAAQTPSDFYNNKLNREDGSLADFAKTAIKTTRTGDAQSERILELGIGGELGIVAKKINDAFLIIKQKTKSLDEKAVRLLQSYIEYKAESLDDVLGLIDRIKGNDATAVAEGGYLYFKDKRLAELRSKKWEDLSGVEQAEVTGLNEKVVADADFAKLKKIVDSEYAKTQGKGSIYENEIPFFYLNADYAKAKDIQDKIAKKLGLKWYQGTLGGRRIEVPKPKDWKGVSQPQETVQKPAEFTELEQTPKTEQAESKEAISATQETGEVTPPPPPQKPAETAEKAPKEGSVQMTLGIRALNSPKLDQDIKEGIAEKGINYEPRGRQVRADEAKEIVDLFGQEEGGLDKIESMVYNTKNDIPNDTRTFLNVYLADAYNNLKNKSIDSAEKDRLRRKVIDLYMFGMEQGKLGGQHVEAQKEWGKVFGSSPEMVSALVRNHIERKNQQFFKSKEEEIAAAKKLLDDVFASPEGKARMEQEVSDEISKIGTKNFGKESKQKIDDFFSKLLIDPKQQNLYGGFLGIPVAAWNGSVLAVKNAVLLGVDLATAIQRGAEYLDKWYKDEYAKGKIASPDWNKAEYESHMRDKLSGLKKEVPTTDKKKATKKEPKPKTPPTQEEVVNKLLEKMAGFATKKQLQNFIKDYIQELQEKGVVDDKRFKDLLSKALGLDYVSDKTEAQLTASAQTLGHAQRKIQEVIDLFNQLESVEPGSREFADLRKKLNEAKKEAEKASFNAQKANQYIKTLLTDEPELLDKVGTLIQGNLLVPTSIIRNLYGNVFMAPARATRFMVMNTADAFLSKVGIARDLMKDPTSSLYINPVKNPELYKWAMKLPTTERTVDMMASFRGYREGVWQGLKEGARQLKTGQLEDDYRKKEIQRGLQPIEALLRLRDSLTGREKRSFDKMVGDLLEALPAGYMGEGMFRLLNLGDKPFRRAAETARLSEIAELKGLKDLQREKFLNNPDNASLEEARKAGDFAVYTNDNAVSKMIDYLNTTFKKGQKSNSDAIKSTSAIAKALFKLGKATTLPYVRTPVNLAVEAFEYAVPTYSLARALESTAKGKRREALDYFGKATVGAIISSVAVALIKNGIMTPAGSDEDKLKQAEFTGKEGYRMNIDAFHRWISGGDPTWQDGDETVTLKGYGTMSMIMMAYGAAYKDKTAEEIEAESNPERWATVFGSVVTSSLEQSIMTGVNTALQAALKGEKERDRWLINTANALSTAVYPNTVASISKTFADENYIRETRDLSKEDGRLKAQMVNTFKDRLFMGKDLPTKVSIWGEPVKMVPDGDNWTYMLLGVTKNKKYQKYSFGVKMYELYEEFKKNNPDDAKNIFPSLPTANSKVGWDDSKMTPHELQNYQMRVGELRAEYAENYVNSEEWKNATIDDRVQKLTSMYSKARKVADSEMFRWSGFEGREPEKWKILSDNDAIPIPSNTKKIKQGQKEWQLEPAEVEILNNIALDRYATLVIPFIEANRDNMATLNKPNEKTGKIPYVERINDKWRMALEYAKREMIRQKVQEQK